MRPAASRSWTICAAPDPGSTATDAPVLSHSARYRFSPKPPPVYVRIRMELPDPEAGRQTVKELPHPQPPEALGLRKEKPWPMKLVT